MLVVGGGVCGVVASEALARLSGRAGAELEVTLVEPTGYHYMPAYFLDLAFGEAGPEDVRAPLDGFAERHGVRLVRGRVAKLDPAERTVVLESGERLSYDYLVVCAGTRHGWEEYPGLRTAHTVHEYEAALRLREALAGFHGGRVVVLVPEFPFRCPGVVFELAGKVLVLAERRGVLDRTRVTIVHRLPRDQAMGRFGDVAAAVMKALEAYGDRLEMVFGARVSEVDARSRKVVLEDGDRIGYDLLVSTPPPRPPRPFDEAGLAWSRDPRFLETLPPRFRSRRWDDVYVPTDSAMPSAGLVFAGVPVHLAAQAAAESIVGDAAGYPVSEPAFPRSLLFMLDVGVTGALVAFDVWRQGEGFRVRPYVALTSPLVRLLKRSYYHSWVERVRAGGG